MANLKIHDGDTIDIYDTEEYKKNNVSLYDENNEIIKIDKSDNIRFQFSKDPNMPIVLFASLNSEESNIIIFYMIPKLLFERDSFPVSIYIYDSNKKLKNFIDFTMNIIKEA